MVPVKSYGCSFIGRRKNNEDSFIISEFLPGFNVYAVADGMGGANAGEIASSLALEVITNHLRNELTPDKEYSDDELSTVIKEGYSKIQNAIADDIKSNPEHSGMGTTLVLLLTTKTNWICANIGDSRLYFVNDKEIVQITKDHSLFQEYINKNGQVPDESWVRKYSSYITKALDGSSNEPDIFILSNELKDSGKGFCLLLCSDGMLPKTFTQDEDNARSIICGSRNLREASEQLISNAFYNGSADNITVVLIESPHFKRTSHRKKKYPFPPVEAASPIPSKRKPGSILYIILSGILVCIIAFIFLLPGSRTILNTSGGSTPETPFLENSKSTIKTSPIKNLNIEWHPFDPGDYRLPVSDSSIITWNLFNDPSAVESYIIYVKRQDLIVDSVKVNPRKNSILFGEFTRLSPGSEYQVSIKAITSDRAVYKGNTFKFKYQ